MRRKVFCLKKKSVDQFVCFRSLQRPATTRRKNFRNQTFSFEKYSTRIESPGHLTQLHFMFVNKQFTTLNFFIQFWILYYIAFVKIPIIIIFCFHLYDFDSVTRSLCSFSSFHFFMLSSYLFWYPSKIVWFLIFSFFYMFSNHAK